MADIVCNKKLLTVQTGAFDAYARSWNVILRSGLLLWKFKGGKRKRMGGANGVKKKENSCNINGGKSRTVLCCSMRKKNIVVSLAPPAVEHYSPAIESRNNNLESFLDNAGNQFRQK